MKFFYFLSNISESMPLTKLSAMDAITAVPRLLTYAPGTMEKANESTAPLITNENRPSERNVNGNEKNCSTGFTTALHSARIKVNAIRLSPEITIPANK